MPVETTQTTEMTPSAPPPEAEYLDRQQITDALSDIGATYPMIRRYAEAPGVAELMGAYSVKGQKGVRYPLSALERFRLLVNLQVQGVLTPSKAAEVLSRTPPESSGTDIAQSVNGQSVNGQSVNDGDQSPVGFVRSGVAQSVNGTINQAQLQNAQTMHLILTLMQRFLDRAEQKQITGPACPAVDPAAPVLTTCETAVVLRCKPEQVGRLVPHMRGRRGVYARVDIDAYIESHSAAA